MMERLRESKWVYILCSIALALLFWMYVRVTVDPTDTQTIRNVRVVQTGTSVLTSQGLTVSGISDETVDLQVEAPSSVITNLLRYRGDIYVNLDVSRCVEGENRVAVGQPVWPTNFSTEGLVLRERDPSTITVTVEELYTRTFDVEFQLDGQVADGYQMGLPAIEPATVTVSGSVEEVSQVARVVAVLTNENLSERYADLTGVDLTVADACLALTLTQLPQVETVYVTAEGSEIPYRPIQQLSAADVAFPFDPAPTPEAEPSPGPTP